MEGPLKERLTGALIVVAVLVIVIPEMLSGPSRSRTAVSTDAQAGPPVRTYSLDLGNTAQAPSQDQSALTPQSTEPVATVTVGSATAPAAPAVAVPQGNAPAPIAEKPASEPQPAPPPAAPVAVAPAAEPAPPPRPAVADVKPSAPPVAAKGQWWTQLGSFSARDNADRLARDLRGAGYTINVAKIKVANRELYRVRAGPVASREAAVALQARLAAAGHKSSLVPP